MESIEVEVKLNRIVDAEVHIQDVIEAINNLEMPRRWNYLAEILNNIELLYGIGGMDDDKNQIVRDFLEKKLRNFNK